MIYFVWDSLIFWRSIKEKVINWMEIPSQNLKKSTQWNMTVQIKILFYKYDLQWHAVRLEACLLTSMPGTPT